MNWTEKETAYGDIIRVKVNLFYHYGIFIDENTVIQFGLPDNGTTPHDDIRILSTDISTFANGGFVETESLTLTEKLKRYSPEKTVKTAMSRIGENGYNILHNNCEHFVMECAFGEKKSFLDDVRESIKKQLNIR